MAKNGTTSSPLIRAIVLHISNRKSRPRISRAFFLLGIGTRINLDGNRLRVCNNEFKRTDSSILLPLSFAPSMSRETSELNGRWEAIAGSPIFVERNLGRFSGDSRKYFLHSAQIITSESEQRMHWIGTIKDLSSFQIGMCRQ